jgi:hypothetical protein
VVVNHIGDPHGNPVLLFSGVALIAIAILMNAFAYKLKESGGRKMPIKGIVLAVVWGILIWKEFKGAPRISHALNIGMFVVFLAGLALLIKAGA